MNTGREQGTREQGTYPRSRRASLRPSGAPSCLAHLASRQEKFGPNKLEEAEKTPLWIRFFQQMADPMVIRLIVAAIISAVTGAIQGEIDFADVIIIM